jgi:NADPH-dependent curcumin reductase CurA
LLVHGAAGAVGQALLTLGRLAALELWGAARGEHATLIRELGATPIDYRREDFTRVLPGGFDVVFACCAAGQALLPHLCEGFGRPDDGSTYRRSCLGPKQTHLVCPGERH